MANQKWPTYNIIPSHMKKLPRYSGWRTTEYIPVLFNVLAFWLFLFLPDVFGGTYPITKALITNPINEIAMQMKDNVSSFVLRIESFSAKIIMIAKGYNINGMKLR